jgi:hypothetical protein
MKALKELSQDTIKFYRHLLRKLWLREQGGFASPHDIQARKVMERRLSVKASQIPAQGRPRKTGLKP